jgi:hypothetical protein
MPHEHDNTLSILRAILYLGVFMRYLAFAQLPARDLPG